MSRKRLGGAVGALLVVGLTACAATAGPTIRVDEDGWDANPPSMVQSRARFTLTLLNDLDIPVQFVVVRMEFGEVGGLPTVDGVIDVTRHDVYEDDASPTGSPPAIFTVAYSGVGKDSQTLGDWEPATVAAGASLEVPVGRFGVGGGEPGEYAVISFQPGAIAAGDYVVFALTDESGHVPQHGSIPNG